MSVDQLSRSVIYPSQLVGRYLCPLLTTKCCRRGSKVCSDFHQSWISWEKRSMDSKELGVIADRTPRAICKEKPTERAGPPTYGTHFRLACVVCVPTMFRGAECALEVGSPLVMDFLALVKRNCGVSLTLQTYLLSPGVRSMTGHNRQKGCRSSCPNLSTRWY